MKIEEVESLVLGGGHYVRITTEDGITGLGQSGCWAYPEAVHEVVQVFRRHLRGEDPLRTEHHWQYLYRMGPFRGSVLGGAVSAVDIALWDIKGKRFDAPIWQLLGGRCRDQIRLYLLLSSGGTPDELAKGVGDAVGAGYTAVKFDPIPVGYEDMALSALIGETIDMVAAARDAAGSGVDLILELHRKLTPLQAMPLISELGRLRPLFVEDPIQIDSIQTQAEIAQRLALPIANGERLNTIWEFRDLLANGGSQYVRPDVGLAGGLTHCKKIAAIAEAHHSAVVTHNFLGPVLTAASVHLDVAIPNFVVQEYCESDEGPMAAMFPGTLRREGGYLPVPEAPGLGLVLDETRVAPRWPEGFDVSRTPLRRDGSVAYAV
jgi:galactonate dehydratase